jgi:hypothetical protein
MKVMIIKIKSSTEVLDNTQEKITGTTKNKDEKKEELRTTYRKNIKIINKRQLTI